MAKSFLNATDWESWAEARSHQAGAAISRVLGSFPSELLANRLMLKFRDGLLGKPAPDELGYDSDDAQPLQRSKGGQSSGTGGQGNQGASSRKRKKD